MVRSDGVMKSANSSGRKCSIMRKFGHGSVARSLPAIVVVDEDEDVVVSLVAPTDVYCRRATEMD
jgi:hypothetical protein